MAEFLPYPGTMDAAQADGHRAWRSRAYRSMAIAGSGSSCCSADGDADGGLIALAAVVVPVEEDA